MNTLIKFAWLAVVTAIATILIKLYAWHLTGSVGLLSDAVEGVVNLVAAIGALVALTIAARPADDDHQYGHTKAEYFSAGVEGAMIFVAATVILVTATERLLNPQPLDQIGAGIALSLLASVINGVVAFVLVRAGRKHRSITLRADGNHLFTDVLTSVGVVIGIGLVMLTGWEILDSLVAIAVGINILFTGVRLVREAAGGLMDKTLPAEDNAAIEAILERHRREDHVDFHELRTRESGRRRFVEFHALVPGEWTVETGHDLVELVENEIHELLPDSHISSHLEPIEDERAYNDVDL